MVQSFNLMIVVLLGKEFFEDDEEVLKQLGGWDVGGFGIDGKQGLRVGEIVIEMELDGQLVLFDFFCELVEIYYKCFYVDYKVVLGDGVEFIIYV